MISAINDRRSIRKFLDMPITEADILAIIQSGRQAPSSKNRQPWRFVIVQGDAKKDMLQAFQRGLVREETTNALLPQSKQHLAAAKYTATIMAEAPVIVCVINTLGQGMTNDMTFEDHVYEICNIQSIGAAVENMLLTATEKGIGSLWICDIYFAYTELCEWLDGEGQLIAAIAFGYPDESPQARPRKALEDIVEWRR